MAVHEDFRCGEADATVRMFEHFLNGRNWPRRYPQGFGNAQQEPGSAGASEEASMATFQAPSGCFFQMVM